MKQFTFSLLLLAIALTTIAQNNQSGYVVLRGGPSFKDNTTKGIASISVGLLSKGTVGIGGGFGFINYEKPYIPLTIDISFFGKPGKVSPVIIGQAGYGVYNYSSIYVVGRGGFTGSISAGVGLPVKSKNKFIVTVGYYTYGFTTTTKGQNGTSMRTASKDNRLAATFGVKI